VIRANRRTAAAATIESPLSVQRLTTEVIRSNPGGNFDISKVIQTLPGVGGGVGGLAQVSRRIFDSRLGLSAGLRADTNTFTTEGDNPLKALSPRVSFSYVLTDRWTMNASIGRYFKIPPYTVLGFASNDGLLVNKASS
jgi:outer membrane receptor protein involved in Fe transport